MLCVTISNVPNCMLIQETVLFQRCKLIRRYEHYTVAINTDNLNPGVETVLLDILSRTRLRLRIYFRAQKEP